MRGRFIPRLKIAQLSQTYRANGKPYALGGCLTPPNSEIVGSDCSSSNSRWRFKHKSAHRGQIVHYNSDKCIKANLAMSAIEMATCDDGDVTQKWHIDIKKD